MCEDCEPRVIEYLDDRNGGVWRTKLVHQWDCPELKRQRALAARELRRAKDLMHRSR